jgi:mRNA interferase RelE/StbE
MPGWATQIYSREFDASLERVPEAQRAAILEKISDMGRRLESYPHYRMTGRDDYRLRVGDYRIIYRFDVGRGEIQLFALGHRREIYR